MRLFLLISFFLIVAILVVLIVIYYCNKKSPSTLKQPFDVEKLIGYLPDIEKENKELLEYTFLQLRLYLQDLVEAGSLSIGEFNQIISGYYTSSTLFKFLLEGGVINWDDYLNKFFYPVPTTPS